MMILLEGEDGTFLCPCNEVAVSDLIVELDEAKRGRILSLAREMQEYGTQRDGPLRNSMSYVGDRWSALILLILQSGRWRHAILRRMLAELSDEGAISQRVLTLKLRALERDGYVERSISEDVPPKVSYRLTPLGEGFVVQLREMLEWLKDNRDRILEARAKFDSED